MGLATIIRKSKLRERNLRIIILGLDSAGKSSILSRYLELPDKIGVRQEFDKISTAIAPTFGFKIHTKSFIFQATTKISLNFWDIGGQRGIREFWSNYYEATDAIIFVVDSSAPSRLQESLDELATILNAETLRTASILILANKQDCPNALSPSVLRELFKLDDQFSSKPWDECDQRGGGERKTHWAIKGCSAIDGSGIQESIQYLLDDLCTNILML